MSRSLYASLALILALVAPRTVLADDPLVRRLDLLEQIVAQQQQELATFRAADYTTQMASYTTGTYDRNCGTCAKPHNASVSCGGGVYAAAEATFLRPYLSTDGLAAVLPGPPNPGTLQSEYTFAPRFIIGYEGATGLGIRARYWFYDQDFAVDGLAVGTFGIDMDALDLEATLRQDLGRWDLQFAGGVRYGRGELSSQGLQTAFEGTGLTVAAEVTRPIFNRYWSLLGNFRGSLLFGELRDNGLVLGGLGTSENEIMQVWEIQLGVEYAREMFAGEVAIQFLWEAQHWENSTLTAYIGDLGFAGPTLKVELRR